jgi:UDP-glucose 4-epimerase
MKILVTGGMGFIGTHLIKSLDRNKFEISILDNREEFLDLFKTQENISIINADIQDYESIHNLVRGFDTIIHLAAKISVSESITNPELIHNVNVTGTLNLLRSCVKNNIKNFIAASSASVYGASIDQPLTEKSETIPMSPYGASKLAMEYYMKSFAHSFEMNCISLRFFNIYGNGQSSVYGGVIKKFQDKINQNQSLEIFGDGVNSRDFVHIDDVVNSINLSIKHIKNKKGTVYNIGSGYATSINDIANMMLKISQKNLQIIKNPGMKGDISHSLPSIDLAKNELGYVPKVKLEKGLEDLLSN